MSLTLSRSSRDPHRLYIDWWLMNHCSQNCSYCADIIKNGSVPLPDLRDCQDFVVRADRWARAQGRGLAVNLTGGEVTEWAGLIDLVVELKSRDHGVSVRTNAHQSRSYYEQLFPNLESLRLEFHPEYQNTSHFASVISLARSMGLEVIAQIFMIPDRWQELEDMISRIQSLYPGVMIIRRMLFTDPAVNMQPQNYSQDQRSKLMNQHGDLEFLYQGEHIPTDYMTLVLNDQNRFRTAQCWAGLEQIVIDAWGRVFRGHCRQNGLIGRVGQDIAWPTDPVICAQSHCRNAFDILSTKRSQVT